MVFFRLIARPAHSRFLCVALALFIGASCRPADEPAVSDNGATGSALSLELVSQLGCGDCEDERQLTPAVLALLDEGRVGVLDLYEPFVRVFGASGEVELAFGRKGQGPGEIGLATGAAYLPGAWMAANEHGGLTVVDALPWTLEIFDAAGAFVAQQRLDTPDGVPAGQASSVENGTYYQLSFAFMGGEASERITRCRLLTTPEPQCELFAAAAPFLAVGPPEARVGWLSIAATPDGGLVVANIAAYQIWVLDEDANVVLQTGRSIPRPAKSDAEIAREEAANQDRRVAGRAEREIDPQRGHIDSYGIQVDGAGRIWVLTQRYGDDTSVFDVFAADGTYLTELTVDAVIRRGPWNVTPFVAAGDRLAAITQQPDGNEFVYVYRIAQE